MVNVSFLVPGNISQPTGGYHYDRELLRFLPNEGINISHVELPSSFPYPSERDLVATRDIILNIPNENILLIDGLAYGAMPFSFLKNINHNIVALCHHPLALENGLSLEKAQYFHDVESYALSFSKHIIVTSPLTAKILEWDFNISSNKITIAEPGTVRKPRSSGSNGERIEILAVGSIVPRKGYNYLIEALSELELVGLKNENWHLNIVGAAPMSDVKEALHSQIHNENLDKNVSVIGAVNEEELDKYYKNADLFVSPSLFEGYGMALGEAMQRGLPIITTNGGAAKETVPKDAGIKTSPTNVEELQNALRQMIENKQLREQFSQAAYEAGEKLPSWEDNAKIIASCLRKVDLSL